jgi:hypothetical protein
MYEDLPDEHFNGDDKPKKYDMTEDIGCLIILIIIGLIIYFS